MNAVSPGIATDRACLEAWRCHPGGEGLRPLVERYLAFVYSSAHRRSRGPDDAEAVARAAFHVLARRGRKLSKKTVLAGWLFHVTAIACRKLPGNASWTSRWCWFRRTPKRPLFAADEPMWSRLTPEIDAAIERLPAAQRDAILLQAFLSFDAVPAARFLGISETRARKRLGQGLNNLVRRLRGRGGATTAEALASMCATEGCAVPVPEGLAEKILIAIEATGGRRPRAKLARRVLAMLGWERWRRRAAIGIPTLILSLAILGGGAWYLDSLSGHSRLISLFLVWSVKYEGRRVRGLAQPARPWPVPAAPRLNAAAVRTAGDFYQTTNIWLVHLQFAREQWTALEPKRIQPLPHFVQPNGTLLLRHPDAQRSGLAGVLGFDFNWVTAGLELGGVSFSNVAARVKGNGSYLSSLYGDKRSFKVDLNKFVRHQNLGELEGLVFNNLVNDYSCLSDALAYEFFREAGVPAPRTAYAYLTVSVDGKWDRKPLGLYGMVEPVDEHFARERFGSKRAPIFKPVTYDFLKYLGEDWGAYAAIYDLKTKATAGQRRRLIEFARLVTAAEDAEFALRVGEFLDLEQFARYLAGQVLLSNYDSFLSNGQNFYFYLDPSSGKFGFIPWDLDASWGSFLLKGTPDERERISRASIWHPWVGRHRLLERVLGVEEFRQLYRAQLEELLARLFIPGRLHQRMDEVANVIRGPIAAESDFRLGKFEQAMSEKPVEPYDGPFPWVNGPAHQIKRFVQKRAVSVRKQLDGKSKGTILDRRTRQ